jgi:hypothetical protein
MTSEAINKGIDLGMTTDFEGDPRPQAGAPDIGYDESAFAPPVYLPLVVK